MTIKASELEALGRAAGLCAVGVCRAEPFTDTNDILNERKQAGLHAGMQFTYRNPQRSTDPSHLVADAAALVVGAWPFDAGRAEPPPDAGHRPYARVAAYSRDDYYASLRDALEVMAQALRADGYTAVVSADSNGLVDRAAAHRAGIGWWGKNSNILTAGSGSLVVLGAVVTNAPLVSADPKPVADGCGSCRRCMDGCPTGAIIAAGTVDARRCLAWLVQADGLFDPDYRIALGDRIYGCDDCSDVCPPNRVHVRRKAQQEPWVEVLGLLDASDEELMERFGRWYMPRRQPRYLRRNALVVLANIADPADGRVRAAVERALGDPDPLIAAHAVWCARRLGLDLEALADHDDAMVAAELQRSVPVRAAA